MGPPVGESPIYDQLSQEWTSAGRTLPGVPDLEWTRLAQYPTPQPTPGDLLTGPPPTPWPWRPDPTRRT
ncbi:hypothetical protein ACWF94_21220 [Streptomyces sp. NPDC055078]